MLAALIRQGRKEKVRYFFLLFLLCFILIIYSDLPIALTASNQTRGGRAAGLNLAVGQRTVAGQRVGQGQRVWVCVPVKTTGPMLVAIQDTRSTPYLLSAAKKEGLGRY